MKKTGPYLLLVVFIAIGAAVYLSPVSPSLQESAQDKALHRENAGHQAHLDEKVEEAKRIIQEGGQPPMVAIGMIREVLEEDPNHVPALMALGSFSIQSGQFDKAVERYTHVLDLETDNEDALTGLVHALVSLDRFDQAESVLNDFVENNPESEKANLIRGEFEKIRKTK